VAIMPGYHVITVRKYAPDTSVPVLLDGKEAVQGSSEIIDYIEQKYPPQSLTPRDAYDEYQDHSVSEWVRHIYRNHRLREDANHQ
jgi:glutathione S-transferase